MKILQIGKFFPPYFYGGIETVSYNLHQALQNIPNLQSDFLGFLPKKYNHDIKVNDHIYLCKTDIDKFSTQISKSFLMKYKEIRNDYDIIFVNLPHPVANMVICLLKPKKAKIILYWHSDIIKQKKLLKLYSPFLKKLINMSAIVAAPTSIHLEKSDFSKYFAGKKIVLPFILNYETKPSCYKLTTEGKKVIFACGRLIYYKGFSVLIEAAKSINDSAVIRISGVGPLENILQKQIDDNGLQSKVKLLGRLSDEDLHDEYKNCYLYCFPSIERAEMMGMVQYEALSYGKPIISTNIFRSGAPTLNREGVSGFHVDVGDSRALSEKINMVLDDEKLYTKLCAGAADLSRQYNDKSVINKYIDVFEKLDNSFVK